MSAPGKGVDARIDAHVGKVCARLADRLEAAGVPAETVAGGVTATGPGLRARHLLDPALRWPAGLLR